MGSSPPTPHMQLSRYARPRAYPCVVFVFYCKFSIAVNNPNNAALQIVEIAVYRTIKIDHSGTGFIIIEEVHLIASPGQMCHQLAVQGVVRGFLRYRLPWPPSSACADRCDRA